VKDFFTTKITKNTKVKGMKDKNQIEVFVFFVAVLRVLRG